MDYLSIIKRPIETEFREFNDLFAASLSSDTELLGQVFSHIKQRMGKRMRPMLILLTNKAFGEVTQVSQYAAVGLELLHTASLVHDDVVDESDERRGQASLNAVYDNRVSVLVGDYILATALLKISQTRNFAVVDYLSELGRTLSSGEIIQYKISSADTLSESTYFEVIKRKTASLFETCAGIGAMCAGVSDKIVDKAKKFGQDLGVAFQIRDDIFDYYDNTEIGKPTGNDMREGKLTLPVIYALNSTGDATYRELAMKVRKGDVTKEEIGRLVTFTKQNGGIEYAQKRMSDYRASAMGFIEENVSRADVAESLSVYVDYVVGRDI